MPTISTFYGILIQMYWNEHAPPHFHAIYGEAKATIDIHTLTISEGTLPRRITQLVLRWAKLHQTELIADWELCLAKERPKNIDPLSREESRMYWDIEEVRPVAPRTLAVRFSDGLSGTVRINKSFCTGVFSALQEDGAVSEVRIEHGVLVWPNGLDLAPDTMYREIKNNPDRHYELQ